MLNKGWFTTPGRAGDRTLEQQVQGLGAAFRYAAGRTVLDVGCAEGLISRAIYTAGAGAVLGVEIVPGHVEVARRLTQGMVGVDFKVADANTYEPGIHYDVMLLLAILHKLKDPTAACRRLMKHCNNLCVVRLPPATAPVIIDARSGNVPHNIQAAMEASNFYLDGTSTGAFNEWVGYFWRMPGTNK